VEEATVAADPALVQASEENRPPLGLLIFSIFIVAACSLAYELLLATAASYLLGDTVLQFSLTIGIFLSSMGIGSYLSQFIRGRVLSRLVWLEAALGIIGGASVFALYFAFVYLQPWFQTAFFGVVTLIGILSGLEVPLFVRLLRHCFPIEKNIANTLTFDYLGALAASILFPLLLYPVFGLERTACLIGISNLIIGIMLSRYCGKKLAHTRYIIVTLLAISLFISLTFMTRDINTFFMERIFRGAVLFSKRSPYQSISLVKKRDDIRMYINHNLQFCSLDEHRYHETLVHTTLGLAGARGQVLILGGGDGMAAREVLKYADVQRILLVDIDPMVIDLATHHPILRRLNTASLADPRVEVRIDDAFRFVRDYHQGLRFDIVLIDLPDPSSINLARLFSLEFYWAVRRLMTDQALLCVQSTSPTFAPRSYRCIQNTLQHAGFHTLGLHVFVPSFGDWGFNLAALRPLTKEQLTLRRNIPTLYLDADTLAMLPLFPRDMPAPEVGINSLVNLRLSRYYQEDWDRYVSGLILN